MTSLFFRNRDSKFQILDTRRLSDIIDMQMHVLNQMEDHKIMRSQYLDCLDAHLSLINCQAFKLQACKSP